MQTDIVDKIPVATLFPDRYGLGKTKVYEYLKDLGIRPFSDGRKSFISFEQLKLLDEYAKVAPDREAAAEFLNNLNQSEQVREHVQTMTHQASGSPAWLLFAEAIASRLT
ncbi:hypothetical protein IQ268_12595, partial [Oculatella sp. LEGE 06141]